MITHTRNTLAKRASVPQKQNEQQPLAVSNNCELRIKQNVIFRITIL